MRASARVLPALLLLVLAASPAIAAPGDRFEIRRVDTGDFPEVSILTSVDSSEPLSADNIVIREDGVAVEDVTVTPLREEVPRIDAVLVIDTSGSMEDGPLRAAIDAAERFVARLPATIRVGLVAFSDRPRILHRISYERPGLLADIASLSASGETALYDATITAARMFEGEAQRNIILLSDGGDTASRQTLRSAVSLARRRNAVAFTVGLKSGEFDEQALRFMANATGGDYAPAASADLGRVYEGLATEISNQYLLTYRSESEGGQETTVEVTAFGRTKGVLTLFPRVEQPPPAAEPAPLAEPETSEPAIRDSWGLALTLGLSFVAAFVALLVLFGKRYAETRERELSRLMMAEKSDHADVHVRSQRTFRWIPSTLVRVAARFTDREGIGEALDLKIERAGLPLSPAEFFATSIVAAFTGAIVGAVVLNHFLFVLLTACLGAGIPNLVVAILSRRRFTRLHAQLPDILMILASSIRSGHSFLQALDMVAKESGEPGSSEFARLVAEIRLGRPMEEAMLAMSDRVGSPDFEWAVMAVNIQREVGGNLTELLDGIADMLRERETLRRQVDVLAAEGRLSIGILTALPVLLMLYLAIANPDYLDLLFSTRIGVILLSAAGGLLVIGFLWMRRMIKIDV
jgi:tight adherence protein B